MAALPALDDASAAAWRTHPMPTDDRTAAIDDELLMIRNSGEIPEVALHNALHFLSQDPEGPGLTLAPDELCRLQQAVVERYRRIILRDLDPRLRDKSVYRGLTRCITNWKRLGRFIARAPFAIQTLKTEIAHALQNFLEEEINDVASGRRDTCIDCSLRDLQAFSDAVGFDLDDLPPDWKRHLRLT
jgi:hypothetical protein